MSLATKNIGSGIFLVIRPIEAAIEAADILIWNRWIENVILIHLRVVTTAYECSSLDPSSIDPILDNAQHMINQYGNQFVSSCPIKWRYIHYILYCTDIRTSDDMSLDYWTCTYCSFASFCRQKKNVAIQQLQYHCNLQFIAIYHRPHERPLLGSAVDFCRWYSAIARSWRQSVTVNLV